MRTILSTVLLLIAFAVGQAGAAELTAALAQQILSAAKTNSEEKVTLLIDGKSVVFTVTRDAVGNVIARPVPGPDASAIGIAQISIGSTVSASSGALLPSSLLVVNNDQSVIAYNVSANQEGTIASLGRVGGGSVVSVVNNVNAKTVDLTVQNGGGGGGSFNFTVTLPAGTLPSQYASTSNP